MSSCRSARGVVTGIVVARDVAAPETGEIKPVREVLDQEAFVPLEVVALAKWTAEYYACGVGDAIPLLLPPMARGARADAHKTRRVASDHRPDCRRCDAVSDRGRNGVATVSDPGSRRHHAQAA